MIHLTVSAKLHIYTNTLIRMKFERFEKSVLLLVAVVCWFSLKWREGALP